MGNPASMAALGSDVPHEWSQRMAGVCLGGHDEKRGRPKWEAGVVIVRGSYSSGIAAARVKHRLDLVERIRRVAEASNAPRGSLAPKWFWWALVVVSASCATDVERIRHHGRCIVGSPTKSKLTGEITR